MTSPPDWQLHALLPAQGLGPHRKAWDSLCQSLLGSHAMLDGRFVDALLRHFGEQRVLLAIASRKSEPVAMLLLNGRAGRLGLWTSFLPSQTQIGPSLVPAGLDLRGLFAALPGYATELDLLCNDPRFGDLRDLPSPAVGSLPHTLTMAVDLRGSFDDYWAQRPRNLIKNMRRYSRRLEEESNPSRLDIVSQPEAIATAVGRYGDLESGGWKGREGTAINRDNAQGRFYAEVMRAFAARGEGLVYELWLGDELLASRLVLVSGRMAIILKTAYKEAFERLAPGRLLLMRVLEDLFARIPGGVVEFYTDANSDQLSWATSQRWIHHVSVYRHRSLPTLYGLLRRGARRLLRRDSPPTAVDLIVGRSGASVESFGHVRELPADALALMERAEQQHIEFGADWYTNLIDTVHARDSEAGGVDLHVLRRQGRVLAVLPTTTQDGAQDGLPVRKVGALANYYTALFAPALADGVEAEDLLPLTHALRGANSSAATYRFSPMDPASREFAVLRRALTLAGLRVREHFAFGNWYERVDRNWDEYLKSRDGKVRSTIKRKGKSFEQEGGTLEIVQGGERLEAVIDAYQAVYAKSWKVPEPYPDFMPGLIRLCARRGWLRLGLAWLGGKPVAAQLWIIANDRASIFKLAYDEAYKAYAPGTLLTALLMEQAIDIDQVREIDYLIGDDPYKAAWMSQRRERFGLVAFDPQTLRGLLGLARQTVGDAWRRLRRKPRVPTDNPAV